MEKKTAGEGERSAVRRKAEAETEVCTQITVVTAQTLQNKRFYYLFIYLFSISAQY